jgi:hypothetical protein
MPEARTGLARELATKSETRSSSLKDVFIGRTAENREFSRVALLVTIAACAR